MNVLEAFRRVRTRRKLSKFLSPALVQSVLDAERSEGIPRTELMPFQYVLVHIREAEPDEIPKLITKVVDAFLGHRAIVTYAAPCLLVGYIGLPNAKYDSIEARTSLVAALLAENGSAVRLAHGQCNGLAGNFGSPRHMLYGAIIPNFSAVLKKLLDIEFGTAVEIS